MKGGENVDGNFSDKMNSILSDPESMEKIMSLAKSLGEKKESTEEVKSEPAPDILKGIASSPLFRMLTEGEKERICLLRALKPYMSEARRAKLDTVISAMEGLEALGSVTKIL